MDSSSFLFQIRKLTTTIIQTIQGYQLRDAKALWIILELLEG
jgi:hypothetical protein